MSASQPEKRLLTGEDCQNFCITACFSFAVFYLISYLAVAALSLTYPFQLEWMEGQVIDIIARARAGLPVYAKPSVDFVSFPYTPFYFYINALLSFITGVEFWPARLVSASAALGIGGIIYRWVRREGGDQRLGLISASLFFATYQISGRWFDVARVDSLFLFLTIASLYLFAYSRNTRDYLVTALVMALAFFTKQTASLIMAPVFFAMLFVDFRRAFITGLALGLLVLGVSIGFNVASDGWFAFFVFELQAGHEMVKRHILGFWRQDMFRHMAVVMLISVISVGYLTYTERKKGLILAGMMVGFVGCSYAARVNWGSYFNVMMPAYAFMALATGLYLARTRSLIQPWIYAFLLMHMVSLFYNPAKLIPSKESVEEGNRFLARIAQIDGDVLLPEWQFIQTRVGKKSFTLGMASVDLIRTDMGNKNHIKNELLKEIEEAITSRRFAAIMPGGIVPTPGLHAFYRRTDTLRFPREYITGATNFRKTDLYEPLSKEEIIRRDSPELRVGRPQMSIPAKPVENLEPELESGPNTVIDDSEPDAAQQQEDSLQPSEINPTEPNNP